MRPPALVSTLGLFGLIALACGGSDDAATDEGTPPATNPMSGAGSKADPYKAECSYSGKDLVGNVGDSFYVSCPADCTTGSVWGVGPYTRDSRLCTAAIHGGAIPASGGLFKASIAAGQSAYESSEANGIKSSTWGSYDTSLVVAAVAAAAPKQEAPKPDAPAPGGGAAKPAGPGKAGKLGRPH